ncbi:hypothetical protein RFI_10186 [Reticulomyxa filosa]|uniref:Uncharacterized protein n=1 Tax=Reticulomyxa filosa TaxID=46433 RepID=X6NLT6_RETFI|nr:hypothetical protein RFI_10186 [Reticulomyxa filosa]|eukprot:ETO26946.1 hypothetical protein RFI_10186 [Reticulomyxa filosa]
MSKFQSREESFYAMSCSMRVLPFFKSPGYMRGMFLLDGVFSAIFTIPPDQNEDYVIRITPCSNLLSGIRADIQPDVYDKDEYFRIIDILKVPNLEEILIQFRQGYKDALRSRDRLIAKGMIPKKKDTPKSDKTGTKDHDTSENMMSLEQWLSYIRMHGQKILSDVKVAPGNLFVGDVEKLRKQDFSALM